MKRRKYNGKQSSSLDLKIIGTRKTPSPMESERGKKKNRQKHAKAIP
jgi:hypothetical protein